MTRRDTIIIAAVVNLGLLACLFVTATREESPKLPLLTQEEVKKTEVEIPLDTGSDMREDHLAFNDQNDEVDQALKEFLPEPINEEPLSMPLPEENIETELNQEIAKPKKEKAEPIAQASPSTPIQTTEVTVKKGDMLEKIAKANNTTVKAIRDLNKLTSDKLKIGQTLKVPANSQAPKPPSKKEIVKNDEVKSGDPVYYTVKPGDNPWKIAKQFNVKFEDILKLNNMAEDKAKNLKVGEQIRVK
jgi:LysM repeat protein